VAAYQNGDVVFSNLLGQTLSHLKYDNRLAGIRVLHDRGLLLGCTQTGSISLRKIDTGEVVKTIDLNRPATSICYSKTDNRLVVTGGEGRLAELVDIESGKSIWKARNVANDFLDMVVPMWDKDLDWIEECKKVFVVVTAYHQIRLYDARAKRRPIMTQEVGERPFTCVRVNPTSNHVIAAGSTTADLQIYDLRHKCTNLGRYKGIAGSIRSVSYHPSGQYLAAVGLDRYVHLFDSKTRKHINKSFVKQRLNKVLISSQLIQPKETNEESNNETSEQQDEENEEYSDDDEENSDDVLQTLQVVGDKNRVSKEKKTPKRSAKKSGKRKRQDEELHKSKKQAK